MALPVQKPDELRELEPTPALLSCPICEGKMEVVYARNKQQVCVCQDCHSGLTVPATAWAVVRGKRDAKWKPKP